MGDLTSKSILKDGDTQVAGCVVRLLGVLYDGMLVLALLFLVSVVLVSLGTVWFGTVGHSAAEAKQLPAWYRTFVLSPSFVLTLIGFYGVFWHKSGQTLGMQTWRLKVVRRDGALLSFGQSAWRILCACLVPCIAAVVGAALYRSYNGMVFSAIFGFLLNYLCCCIHPAGLALHDWLSNTVTVRIRPVQSGWFGRGKN